MSDVLLTKDYLLGRNYTKFVTNHSSPSIQIRNLSFFSMEVDVQNNICEEKEPNEFECYERDVMFGVLTLAFILSSGHMMIQIVFDQDLVSSLLVKCYNFLCCRDGDWPGLAWIFLSVSILIITIWYLAAGPSLPLGIFIAVSLLVFVVSLSSVLTDTTNGYEHSYLTLSHKAFYPVWILFSPIVLLCYKLRAVFPHSSFVRLQRQIIYQSEALLEATPQLCLQLYILFDRSDRRPNLVQLISIVSSGLALCLPAVEKYLIEKTGKQAQISEQILYFPLFCITTIFRVTSISLLLIFFSSCVWTLLFLLLNSLLLTFLLRKLETRSLGGSCSDVSPAREGVTNAMMRVTNLEASPVSCWWRRVTFVYYLGLYTFLLTTILLICNLYPSTSVWAPETLDYVRWDQLNIFNYVNYVIPATLACGLLSLLMDLLYSFSDRGIFVFQNRCDVFRFSWNVRLPTPGNILCDDVWEASCMMMSAVPYGEIFYPLPFEEIQSQPTIRSLL